MQWPEKPTCHAINPVFTFSDMTWRAPKPLESKSENDPGTHLGYHARTCSYCGSLHPEDLYNLLQMPGTKLGGADWKYGWPHKFYVEVPQTTGYGASLHGKWYNEHLNDEGLDEETFTRLTQLILEKSGIEFYKNEGRLLYKAPYAGYQR